MYVVQVPKKYFKVTTTLWLLCYKNSNLCISIMHDTTTLIKNEAFFSLSFFFLKVLWRTLSLAVREFFLQFHFIKTFYHRCQECVGIERGEEGGGTIFFGGLYLKRILFWNFLKSNLKKILYTFLKSKVGFFLCSRRTISKSRLKSFLDSLELLGSSI